MASGRSRLCAVVAVGLVACAMNLAAASPCVGLNVAAWNGVALAVPSYTLVMRTGATDIPAMTCFTVGPGTQNSAGRYRGNWRQLTNGHQTYGYAPTTFRDHVKGSGGGIGGGGRRWNRGHLVADRYFNDNSDKANTYFMANMVPQLYHCNGGWWSHTVEAFVNSYMDNHAQNGDWVFVGTEGNFPDRNNPAQSQYPGDNANDNPVAKTTHGVQHVAWMWTAICKKNKGGYMLAAGNPNNRYCYPQHTGAMPAALNGVIGLLNGICGTRKLWGSWATNA